jgi:hypothetical protein
VQTLDLGDKEFAVSRLGHDAPPGTLMEVHELLGRQRPAKDAPVGEWVAYYRRSAALYAEIAEVDRGHHHEALYWAARERRRADELG